MEYHTQHYVVCKLGLWALGNCEKMEGTILYCKMSSINLTSYRKHFFLGMTVYCAFSFCEKTSFCCFSNTFGLHLKFHWVRQKEIILNMQLHQVTFWPSHYTSLAVSDVPCSRPTLTSALTSEDESCQTSKNCSASPDKDCSMYQYLPFPHIPQFPQNDT